MNVRPGMYRSWTELADHVITLGCWVLVFVGMAFWIYKVWEAYSKGLLP